MLKVTCEYLTGAFAGRTVTVEGAVIKIGRHPDNQIAFDPQTDRDVSGHHAELRQVANGVQLVDVGSANGTFVDGRRVSQCAASEGLKVQFGPTGPTIRLAFAPGLIAAKSPAPLVPPMVQPPRGAPAAGAPGKVGQRTVALMIDRAMRGSRRRFKVVVIVAATLMALTVGGFMLLRHREKKETAASQAELRRQMAALMAKQTGATTSAEKEAIAGRLAQLNERLGKSAVAAESGRAIVQGSLNAVFLLGYEASGRPAKGFCTAFAVAKRWLATNAHCVLGIEQFRSGGVEPFLLMNRKPGKRYRIAQAIRHPAYHKPTRKISEDVGLLQVDVDLPNAIALASDEALRKLDSGDVMYTYGFPGRLASVTSPSATLSRGVVGRVTRLDGEFGAFLDNKLIQHSAFTSGGTSGSPIFNAEGQVIAVNAGGYVEPGTLQVMDPSTGRARQLTVAKQLAGYNFGIRVDVLRELMGRYVQ
ncbi:MAG: trypsin-like peptidase domain-containing protein [Deltaproteobacteria bacterium]|nr:trypsin-like peptidase domain-containing protein [Deltaproteobacteria bacterium]